MSLQRQIEASPSQIIHRYWLRIMARGKGAAGSYCYDVAKLYNELHADAARTLPFDLASGSPAQIIDRCYKRVERWVNPLTVQHLPLDVTRALIDAMPESMRRACWAEVLGSLGYLAARQVGPGEGTHAAFADLVDVFGRISQAAAPIMADGKIDAQDRPHAPTMLKKIDEMRGQLSAWEHALRTKALGE